MPPACRFTREQIVAAALAITRERGFAAVTARAIADTLHSSSKVIFSAFSGMDDLLAATIDAADAQYRAYSADFVRDSADPPYKAVGTAYIRFARNEPNLFHLLYMRDRRREDHSGDAENIDHFTFRRSSDARIDLWELSDLSGVWQNALGETLVIDADRMAYLSYTRLSMGSGTIGDDQDGKGPYLAMNGRIYLSPGLDKDRFTLLGQDADGSFSGVFYPYGQAAAYTGLPGASFETDEDGYCRWYSDGHDAFYITGSYTLAEDGLAYRDDGPVYAAGFDPIPYDPAEDWGDSWMSNWG